MGFSRQEYWSGLPFPSQGDVPDPRIELSSLALQANSLSSEPPGKPYAFHKAAYNNCSWVSQEVQVVEPTCQGRRHKTFRFNPWIGKMPRRRAQQSSLAFLPGESPWTEDPGGLQAIGLQRVRHFWNNLTSHMLTSIKLISERLAIWKFKSVFVCVCDSCSVVSDFLHMCFPPWLFVLTWRKSKSLLCPFHHQTQVYGSKSWMVHSPGFSLGQWIQCTLFSMVLKAESKIPLRKCSPCLFISSSIMSHEFPTPSASQHTLSTLTGQSRIYEIMQNWVRAKEGIETFLR